MVKSELLDHTKADIPKCNLQKILLNATWHLKCMPIVTQDPDIKGQNLFQIMNWYNWANISSDGQKTASPHEGFCALYLWGMPQGMVHE